MTIFDWLKQVTHIKDPWSSFSDEDKATFNPYMLHRFISMHEPYIELANYLQKFWVLNHEQIYLIYCSYLPEQKIFAKYIKSTSPKQNNDLLNILANHYKVSIREAKSYIQILSEDAIKEVLKSRGINDEDINKLLKDEKSTKTSKTSTKS
jgi:N-glycosylase/DNA lyase